MSQMPYTERLCELKHDTGPAESGEPISLDHWQTQPPRKAMPRWMVVLLIVVAEIVATAAACLLATFT